MSKDLKSLHLRKNKRIAASMYVNMLKRVNIQEKNPPSKGIIFNLTISTKNNEYAAPHFCQNLALFWHFLTD